MDRRIVQSVDESDEEELEALRMAALRSRRQKESYAQKQQSQRDSREDTRRVSLGCDECSVIETDEQASSSSTDYEEIDLNGTSPSECDEDFETFTDSEKDENVFVKEGSISDTPRRDFENIEANGAASEGEEEYSDSNTAEDQSVVVETEAGVVDNLTITFSNESVENELENRTNLTQNDVEEEEGEEEEEVEEEEEDEEGETEEVEMEEDEEQEQEEQEEEETEEEEGTEEVDIENNSEEESASSSGSDFSEQQHEKEERQCQTSHTRIIITESESEEGKVELVDKKYRETKESAVVNKHKHEVSVNGPLVPALTSVESAIKCSPKDSTVMEKKVAVFSKHHTVERQLPKSTNFGKTASIRDSAAKEVEHKENEVPCSDNLLQDCLLLKSKPVTKVPDVTEVTPKNQKQKGKHSSLSDTKLVKEESLLKTKPVSKTPPRIRDQPEKEGKKNYGSKARPSEKGRLDASLKTAPPDEELDVDADRLSIGTSDEDNEFEQSEEQQPAIKSKIGRHRMAAISSRSRRSRSRDKSSFPRRSWSRDRNHNKVRPYERSRARDSSGLRDNSRLRDRSDSRGRTYYKHSPARNRRARVRDRSPERTYRRNQRSRNERSPLTDRRSDRRRSTRSRSWERQALQRGSVGSIEKRKERKRSRSFGSPSPPIKSKSKPSVSTSGVKPTKRKGSAERARLSSRPVKDGKTDKHQPNEKHKHSQPSKKIKTVVVNGQQEFLRASLPAKQDVDLRERRNPKGEDDLRAKLKSQDSKDRADSKAVESTDSKISAHTRAKRVGKMVSVVRKTGSKTEKEDLDTRVGKSKEKSKNIPKTAEVTVVQKTGNNAGEEDLDTRIAKIREQNKNILKRAREVDADKKKASHGRSHVL